eukprot:109464-Prorocentrum_minimum.AAC.4
MRYCGAAVASGPVAVGLGSRTGRSSARARFQTITSAQNSKKIVPLGRCGAQLRSVWDGQADRQKRKLVSPVQAAADGAAAADSTMEDEMAELRRRRQDPRWWVQARVFDEVEVPVSPDRDEGAELHDYMTLPVSQFTLVGTDSPFMFYFEGHACELNSSANPDICEPTPKHPPIDTEI